MYYFEHIVFSYIIYHGYHIYHGYLVDFYPFKFCIRTTKVYNISLYNNYLFNKQNA